MAGLVENHSGKKPPITASWFVAKSFGVDSREKYSQDQGQSTS